MLGGNTGGLSPTSQAILSPFTIMRADFPECPKPGSAGAIGPEHSPLQSSRARASKLTPSFLAMVPMASRDAAGGRLPDCSQKERLARTLRLPKTPCRFQARAGTHGDPAGLQTAECRMIYGSLQMACSSQRASDQKNKSLLLP